MDPDLQIEFHKQDGDSIRNGELVMILQGKTRSILIAERTALNLLQSK